MRKLNSQDVFKAFRLVTKSGLKDRLNVLIEDIAKNGIESVEKVGISGMLTVLETVAEEKCEKMFYEILAGPYEMTASEVANLDLETMQTMLKQLYSENNLKSFFSALSGLLKSKH